MRWIRPVRLGGSSWTSRNDFSGDDKYILGMGCPLGRTANGRESGDRELRERQRRKETEEEGTLHSC